MNKESIQQWKLIVFDVDGTLAANNETELLPGVAAWREAHPDQAITLCSNQGGVGLRLWMEEGGFGDPQQYPTEASINARLRHIANLMDTDYYVCFAYQSKKSGKWSPTPIGGEALIEWNPRYRKPAPGMLLRAMMDFGADPSDTLMVGDGDEDQQAAQAAGCRFTRADEFFGRVTTGEDWRP